MSAGGQTSRPYRPRSRRLTTLLARWSADPFAVLAGAVAAVVPFVVVIYATRSDPLLSPDSMHYLAVATHIRSGHGITDLTGLPMTVFPPVFPFLLVPGGPSLLWARIVGAAALGVAAWCLFLAVRRRTTTTVGLLAALALGLSAGLVRVASTVWSETPYLAISAATLLVLSHPRLSDRRLISGGLLAAAGFLTRYAGAGLMVAAAVMVALRVWPTARRWRSATVWATAAAVPVAAWLVRNMVATGQPLGPRFEGGSSNPLSTLVDITRGALGELFAGPFRTAATTQWIGLAVLVGLCAAALAVAARLLRRRRADVLDVGMVVYGLTCVVMPVVARMLTSNDIEHRVMSPTMLPAVYVVAVGGSTLWRRITGRRTSPGDVRTSIVTPIGIGLVTVGLAVWTGAGLRWAERTPSMLGGSAGNINQFSAALHTAIDELPGDARILTNSPHRVWWFNRRDPTIFAFARPRPGNSVYPISVADTVAEACTGKAYLAWFTGLRNAGNSPEERRPDLTAIIHLRTVANFPGGELYHLDVPAARCTTATPSTAT